MSTTPKTIKGFIKDYQNNKILPITRAELVLDSLGHVALHSNQFLAGGSDGLNDLPGLLTAAERRIIMGLAENQNVADIYNKLGYINTGIKIGETAVNFYDASGNPTYIKFVNDANGTLAALNPVAVEEGGKTVGHKIALGLATVNVTKTGDAGFVDTVTTDAYGRVTAVNKRLLTNEDIPEALSGKDLTGCTTGTPSTDTALANKSYVDDKFDAVNVVATGALKFVGSLSNKGSAETALKNPDNVNAYYKVTTEFYLSTDYLWGNTGTNSTVKIAAGDTLIIYKEGTADAKFVHVPSGDDITTVTVTTANDSTAPFYEKLGNVTLEFSKLFTVAADNLTAVIGLKQVTAGQGDQDGQDGYLTSADYKTFKNYASTLKVEYTQNAAITSTSAGAYKIGDITIGGTTTSIYGKNSVSTLSLENGSDTANVNNNPILKFTETGVATDVNITLKGGKAIGVKKNGNSVEFNSLYTVDSNSTKYLSISDDNKFKIAIGSTSTSGTNTTILDGLTDYNEFITFKNNSILTHQSAMYYEEVVESLVGDDNTKYQYGNAKLIAAITCTI